VKELGSGTFGVVKEAVDMRDHSSVAIKIIDKDKSEPGSHNLIAHTPTVSSSNTIQREIAVLQKVKHPNICALLDWFETRDKIYMVFEM
jgi:serine/threonine protein kinase